MAGFHPDPGVVIGDAAQGVDHAAPEDDIALGPVDLEVAARSVSIPLPPAGSGDGASRMNTLVLTLKAADERFVAAIRTNDYAAHQAAREDANAAAEELHQLYDSLCDDAR